LHDPAHGLPVRALDVELKKRVWIGPCPFHDGSFQYKPLCRIVLERRSAMVRRDGIACDEKADQQGGDDQSSVAHFHPSIAFLIREPAGCSLISILIMFGSVTFASREPLFSLGRASATVVPDCRNCVTLACASSEYSPMCVKPAGLPLAGAISINV